MNWKTLLALGLALVHDISDTNISEDEALNKLENEIITIIEVVDDIVAILPAGFGPIAKLIVDNPGTDGMEKLYLARPIAEMIYQIWRGLKNVTGMSGVHAFIHNLESGAV